MKTIKFNRETIQILAAEERALRILQSSDFSAKKADFVEGRGKYMNTVLPRSSARREQLGIAERYPPQPETTVLGGGSVRELQFFKMHPRCQTGVFGNPRRINAILNKIATGEA